MKNIRIALLDSGISVEHPYLYQNISELYEIDYKKKELIPCNMQTDINGHGTACASVIKKACPNVEIISLKLLDDNGECNVNQLEISLQCIEDVDVKLINLSLAVTEKTKIEMLHNACKKLSKQGKIIIASLENHTKKSYPAYFKECIGVQGAILEKPEILWFNNKKKIQCVVDSTPYLHCNLEKGYSMFGKSNSYAASKVTGILAQELSLVHNQNICSENILLKYSQKKNWCKWNLRRSQRYPNLLQFKEKSDLLLVNELEQFLKYFLQLDKNLYIRDKMLLSQEVGLQYSHCYNLLQNLEKNFSFKIKDYTEISREYFYFIYNLAFFVQTELRKKEEI